MASIRPLVLALIGGLLPVVASLPGALAADMPDVDYAPPVQEFGSNWYLRGDVGYVLQDSSASGSSSLFDMNTGLLYGTSFSPADLDNTWTIGGGFGFKATEWLRFDVTGDYRGEASGTLNGTFSTYDAWSGTWSTGGNSRDFEGRLSTALFLANAYLDLGTWSGFTPYVGAGIGAGYLSLTNLDIQDVGVTTDFDGKWSFAWALMAGASFQVSPNWLLDFGYRYTSISGVDFTSGVDGVDGLGYMGEAAVHVDDITAHEFRVGARFMID